MEVEGEKCLREGGGGWGKQGRKGEREGANKKIGKRVKDGL